MNYQSLVAQIKTKQNFLCVGLDPDVDKIPVKKDSIFETIFEFNKAIIDATADYCISYKPNTAFFECYGLEGWKALEETVKYIKANYPNHFVIADAKRGDIGNTSAMYAKAFLQNMNCDAITVAPYMGSDSVQPFLGIPNKWVILLALTSNKGSEDFQQVTMGDGLLYETVIQKSLTWANHESMMFVVGATKPEDFTTIRKYAPKHFLLVPGVGAQGGSLAEVCKFGLTEDIGLLINSSRGIIYAGKDANFAQAARVEAEKLAVEMKGYF